MTEHQTHDIAQATSQTVREAGPALKQAGERINEMASEGMEAIRETARQCRGQLMDASSHAVSHIRHHPVQSIVIAALIGATTVTLLSLLRRRH